VDNPVLIVDNQVF